MANEARVFAEGHENCIVRSFTIADGTAVPKGTLLVESSSRTGIAHTAAVKKAVLGYTTMSKEASDGRTQVGCQRTGVVAAILDGQAATGDIAIAGQTTANRVQALRGSGVADFMSVYDSQFQILGRFIEGGADGTTVKLALTLG